MRSLGILSLSLLVGCCSPRTTIVPADDAAVAPDPADSAAAADVLAGEGVSVSVTPLVSEILFEDLEQVRGNPRKINPNTPQLTEPDNLIELRVEPSADAPDLAYEWSSDLGQIVVDDGDRIHFRSDEEGDARVVCEITNRDTKERLHRELTIHIQRALQSFPIIKDDYVVWTLSPSTIQGVHLPTRTLIEIGEGQASSFDGRRVLTKPPTFPDHRLLVYDIATHKTTIIETPTMQTAWDHRHLHISGDRVYWGNTNNNYTRVAHYTMDLRDMIERQVYGLKDVHHTLLAPDQRLLLAERQPSPGHGFSNLLYDPAADTITQLDFADDELVVSWSNPWVAVRSYSGFRLLNLQTGEEREAESTMPDLVSVLVHDDYYGGHAREAFGDEGEVFLYSFDGTVEERVHFGDNEFKSPSLDAGRIVYVDSGDIYLLDGSK